MTSQQYARLNTLLGWMNRQGATWQLDAASLCALITNHNELTVEAVRLRLEAVRVSKLEAEIDRLDAKVLRLTDENEKLQIVADGDEEQLKLVIEQSKTEHQEIVRLMASMRDHERAAWDAAVMAVDDQQAVLFATVRYTDKERNRRYPCEELTNG